MSKITLNLKGWGYRSHGNGVSYPVTLSDYERQTIIHAMTTTSFIYNVAGMGNFKQVSGLQWADDIEKHFDSIQCKEMARIIRSVENGKEA